MIFSENRCPLFGIMLYRFESPSDLIGSPPAVMDRGSRLPACPGTKSMRLKSAIWVAAYVRRCNVEGAFAAVRRRGAEEAGAIFVKLNRLDGSAALFAPAPPTAFDEAHPSKRAV